MGLKSLGSRGDLLRESVFVLWLHFLNILIDYFVYLLVDFLNVSLLYLALISGFAYSHESFKLSLSVCAVIDTHYLPAIFDWHEIKLAKLSILDLFLFFQQASCIART